MKALIIILAAAGLAGCASPEQRAERRWAGPASPEDAYVDYWYSPKPMASSADAVSAIKTGGTWLVTPDNCDITSLEFDQTGLIVRAACRSEVERHEESPYSLSVFGREEESRSFSGQFSANRTETITKPQDFPLRYKELTDIKIGKAEGRPGFAATFLGEAGIVFSLGANDLKSVQELADAVYSLSLAAGAAVRLDTAGMLVKTLNEEQSRLLGLGKSAGARVAVVSKGGPAEAAGILAEDVIISVNGSAGTAGDLAAAITPADKTAKIKLLRRTGFDGEKKIYNCETLEKEVELRH